MQSAPPSIDLVIAVHDRTRPIERAIDSVLRDGVEGTRVIVVCHGLPASSFASAQREFSTPRVEWLEFADGIRSPAGPFMHGLRAADADYVGIMGSDDFLEAGAVAAAARRLIEDPADVLVLPLRHQSGEVLSNPLARKGRVHALDPVRDRLAYRTAPLAFFRRRLIDDLGLALTPGLPTGEDVQFSTKLWFSGARIDFHPADPAYVIGSDAEGRVTSSGLPAREELAAFRALFQQDWVRELGERERTSLAIKVLRIHVLGLMLRRPQAEPVTREDADALADIVAGALALAPRSFRPFSIADRAILDALTVAHPEIDTLSVRVRDRRQAGRFAQLMPKNPLAAFDREGGIRRYLRYRTWP